MTTPAPDSPGRATSGPARESIGVRNANLYLSRELCERYFGTSSAVALLERDELVLVLPLTRESGSGLLLKLRNAHGDRVIHAQEFFREKGFLESDEQMRYWPVTSRGWAS